ncbi:S9 family peptidase [Sphingomonas lutea]|uniref:S9 family peptidase n=1 Tax=Sphingomonas lutea TaxID=1045317 RepID=A0A7G9SHY1_9SPHN|nr:S9 family peptidase [Sphingomonas lutea]QNN67456.1 S9 family peptidase [Sphingomonas lutea]
MNIPADHPSPPTAEQRPHSYERHGVTIEDPWHWLRDPKYPAVDDADVLDYLKAENAYFEHWADEQRPLLDELFAEMKGRIKEDDSSVPLRDGDWEYWWAFKPGAQYRTWYRRPATSTPFVPSEVEGRPPRAEGVSTSLDTSGEGETLFDESAEAEGKDYFRLGALEVSPDGKLLATLVDDNGSERFQLRIRDLATGKDIETVTDVGIGSPVWTSDSAGIVFLEVNDNWRSYRARYHRLGQPADEAVTLYEETEELGFSVGIGRSQDRSLIFISTGDNATSEVRFVSAADPSQPLTLISPRQANREYHVDAAHGKLWIHTNDDHVNFRIAEADLGTPGEWRTVVPGSDRTYLTGIAAYRDHLAISSRVDGLDQLRLRTYADEEKAIAFGEATYSAGFHGNPEFAPASYRLGYSSMVTPMTTYDYHPETGELEVRKVQEIPSGYDASQYATERLMITARDGARVPVSVVYRKGFEKDGAGRLFLYAYGAYGLAIPPVFNSNRISLLDRGWACAIAHIRGGDDLGHQWFLDGKLHKRTNTFNDFVDVARGLVAEKFTAPGKIAINGGSAGGELMGAVVNSDPELWGAVVADVPFVDVLNTMLDDTLPLTPGEWPEWGNPITDKDAFDYIRSYSPYDNVKRQAYPPMLITGGLTDPRVTYWEPAKWGAKLRAHKTDDNLLLVKINMGAGHGGKSGRWEKLHEVAETYAFIMTQVGDE